jgi:peroxiredoxin
MSTKAADRSRVERKAQAEQARREVVRRHRIRVALGATAVLVVGGLIAAMLLSSRSVSSSATRPAPDFTLTSTAGDTVQLSDYRGQDVLLYFSEGAGCQSCLTQMRAIEADAQAFTGAGVTVLPIVMNSRDQITRDMTATGVTTPFLLDDGTVSDQYGVLGKGMHAGLPGHSFVLIDKDGVQRWYGEYPSMWLAPRDLLDQIEKHLAG